MEIEFGHILQNVVFKSCMNCTYRTAGIVSAIYLCVDSGVCVCTFEYCLPVAAEREREREVNPRVSRGAAGEVRH